MKKNLLKTMLVAVLAMSGMSAWAAGYTRTLTDEIQIAGYIFNTLYDFQNNEPAVLPTEGDLRYRSDGIWGLHNFGSGTRSATISVAVEEGQLLVFQEYSTTANLMTAVSGATKNEALSASTGYSCWEVTETAENFSVTTPRYGGLVALAVMDKDNSVETADFTINYVDENGSTLKSETSNGVVGSNPAISKENIWVESVKYIYVSDDAEGMTIESSGTVVTITFRVANQYTLTVNDEVGHLVGESTVYEGETAYVPFCRYKKIDGTLWQKAAFSNVYKVSKANMTEDASEVITYEETEITNVIFMVEGEYVEGLTPINSGTIDARASNAWCAYNPTEEPVVLTTLAAGSYKITVHTVGNTDTSENWIMAGDQQVVNAAFDGNFGIFSAEFTLDAETELTIGQFGAAGGKGIDLFYIQSENGAVTAIQNVAAQAQSSVIFNLAGQQVEKPTKGLYIQNGRKYIVK